MANPNIVGVTSIYGKTSVQELTTTATSIVTNSSDSNKIFKVNSLYISNISGSSSADVTISLHRNSVSYNIATNITVPADATIDILGKTLYLQEGDELRLSADANSMLHGVCSYEEIS
jgi:hypothetical protein